MVMYRYSALIVSLVGLIVFPGHVTQARKNRPCSSLLRCGINVDEKNCQNDDYRAVSLKPCARARALPQTIRRSTRAACRPGTKLQRTMVRMFACRASSLAIFLPHASHFASCRACAQERPLHENAAMVAAARSAPAAAGHHRPAWPSTRPLPSSPSSPPPRLLPLLLRGLAHSRGSTCVGPTMRQSRRKP